MPHETATEAHATGRGRELSIMIGLTDGADYHRERAADNEAIAEHMDRAAKDVGREWLSRGDGTADLSTPPTNDAPRGSQGP